MKKGQTFAPPQSPPVQRRLSQPQGKEERHAYVCQGQHDYKSARLEDAGVEAARTQTWVELQPV